MSTRSDAPRALDRALAPTIAGLACSAASFALVVQQGRLTGASPAANGIVTLAICLVAAVLLAVTFRTGRLAKRAVFLMTFVAIHLAGIGALGLAVLDLAAGGANTILTSTFEAVSGTGSVLLSFYWLRKLRATSADATACVVFVALVVSTIVVALLGIVGPLVRHLAGCALSFVQFALTRISRRYDAPGEVRPAQPGAYLGTGEARYSDHGYLAGALLGVCGIALAAGVAEALTPPTAGLLSLEAARRLIAIICAGIASFSALRHAHAHPERPLAPELWIALGLLVGVGTVLLALGSGPSFVGGAVVTGATLLLQAMAWYLAVAFASFGARDPYVYAAGSWIAFNVCQVVGTGLGYLLSAAAPGNLAPAVAVMGLCTLASTQVVFALLLRDPERTVVLSDLGGENLPAHITPSTIVIAASIEQALLEADAQAQEAKRDQGIDTASVSDDAAAEGGVKHTLSPTSVTATAPGIATQPAGTAQAAENGTPAHNGTQAHNDGLVGAATPTASEPANAPTPTAGPASPEIHIATSVIALGQRFGLTGREIEVLTLYALGHTQARVSEELHLSPNTVHTHIKRIYDKTDLHSRQEILDYLAEYGG